MWKITKAAPRHGRGYRQNMTPTTGNGFSHIRRLLRQRDGSVAGRVAATLAAIAERDPLLHAYVAVSREAALRDALAGDRLIAELGAGAWRDRPLLGITVSIKDLIQTAELPTRRGSLLPNSRPRADAPLVARLRAAGAVIIGKTATSEYGWCGSTRSRLGPATRNPWDARRSAGGSSGGAAAAVAAGLCDAAIGTDGAGSIRIPAAFCGVVGFKPSFGAVPYVPPCADRLAHAGPITACVADAAEILAVIAGAHPADPDSLSAAAMGHAARTRAEAAAGRALRIAWLELPEMDAALRRACAGVPDALSALGHKVDRIEVPFRDPGPALVDLLAAAEAAATPPEAEESADAGRLAVVRYGRTVSGADVQRAEEVRLALRIRLLEVMDDYDLLSVPTVPIEPFGVEEIGPPWAADPEDLAWIAWTPATYPFNATGQPAVSIPVRSGGGPPAGVQLVGRLGEDALVLSAAQALERELGGPGPLAYPSAAASDPAAG